MHAKQAFYQLGYIPSPKCVLLCLWMRVILQGSLTSCPGCTCNVFLLFATSLPCNTTAGPISSKIHTSTLPFQPSRAFPGFILRNTHCASESTSEHGGLLGYPVFPQAAHWTTDAQATGQESSQSPHSSFYCTFFKILVFHEAQTTCNLLL